MMYLPVSPVAPPKSTAFDLFTITHASDPVQPKRARQPPLPGAHWGPSLTQSHGMPEPSERHVSVHIHLLHLLSLFFLKIFQEN